MWLVVIAFCLAALSGRGVQGDREPLRPDPDHAGGRVVSLVGTGFAFAAWEIARGAHRLSSWPSWDPLFVNLASGPGERGNNTSLANNVPRGLQAWQ